MSIKQYLSQENPDYATGVALYQSFGANNNLKRLFSRAETPYSRDKLLYELSKLSDIIKDSLIVVNDNDEKVIPHEKELLNGTNPLEEEPLKNKEIAEDEVPAEIATKIERIAHLGNQRGILSNTLRNYAESDDEGRKQTMEAIEAYTQEIAGLRIDIDNWKIKKPIVEKPVQELVIPDSDLGKLKLKQSLTQRISKAKAKLPGETYEATLRITDNIKHLNEQLQKVNEAINSTKQ